MIFHFYLCDVDDYYTFAGPAAKSDIIEEGDIIYVIDGVCVLRHTSEALVSMLDGPEFSVCDMILLREDKMIHVRLIRK